MVEGSAAGHDRGMNENINDTAQTETNDSTQTDAAENNTNNTNETSEPRQLRRTREGRMIAGVCSGAAEYLGVDANILRLVLVVLTVFGVGLGVAAYALAWLLVPEKGEENSIVQDLINKQQKKKQSS